MSFDPAFAPVLPRTAALTPQGHLSLGGCDAVDLARDFGTPLYVFDETELRKGAREWRAAFQPSPPETTIVYAAKAYLGQAVASLFAEEGLSLDVASGGELAIALAAGFPAARIYLHGNNKSRRELAEALDAGVGYVVIDNLREIALLDELAAAAGKRQKVLLRVSPNVDPRTHRYISTGALDSKFGLALASGDATKGVEAVLAAKALDLVGVHAHIGSQIFEIEPFQQSLAALVEFAAGMRARARFEQVSAGGGFAVQYQRGLPAPSRRDYAAALVATLNESCAKFDLPLPHLVIEPGRSLVARAGVALYTVGGRKDIAGVRTYILVDGGMADNIRPALYGAAYEALLANRPGNEGPTERVTIAGKFCESGDVLVRDVELPRAQPDDVLAVPVSGAYCLPLASNYNASLRPAVVFVKDGLARLVRRRESYDDLLRCESAG